MSWKPEVIADSTGNWCSNGLTFDTQQEAESYVRDLAYRWMAVRKTRVINSDGPATHFWGYGKAQPCEKTG